MRLLPWFSLLLALLVPCGTLLASPVMIGNPGLPGSALSLNTARLLFSGKRRQWSDGQQVHIFVLADDNPLHRQFTQQVLKLYPRQLRRAWDVRTYSGTGQPPELVASPEEMRERVARQPGAVGYLPEDMVDEHIKKIEVE